jgi:hypothetical protein
MYGSELSDTIAYATIMHYRIAEFILRVGGNDIIFAGTAVDVRRRMVPREFDRCANSQGCLILPRGRGSCRAKP